MTATTARSKARVRALDARIGPGELAVALGQNPPTAEQSAVIAAPIGPTLVVAGAGAGKTETMAARVVWMVANGFVHPDQVLGLTFTRKAAQQLTSRIRQRLARLAGSELILRADPSGQLRDSIVGGEPEVSTYHSYAGRLIDEHGLLLPVEPSARLLTETELWQLAYRVVSSWDGDIEFDRTPTSITEAVLALAGQLAEHLVGPDDLREAHTELNKLVHTLPAGPGQRGGPSKALLDVLDTQHNRIALLPLVSRLREVMAREGLLDFGSQMSLAATLASDHADVGVSERSRFRLVLLDEYQDTGHAQRVLLSSLFGGGADAGLAVTAVGDPMQSIYGWRGASAANLPRFTSDFPLPDGRSAPVRELSTSWRNPPEALALANLVAAPLRSRGVAVDELTARPGAAPGDVRLALTETVDEERDWVAARIAAEYDAAYDTGSEPPTAAVLVRRNADAEPMADALRRRGLPVEVVGLGGLLRTPEVADLVAMLRLVADPLAGSAAMRLLTGSRWRLGIGDLRALWDRAARIGARGRRAPSGAVTDQSALDEALVAVVPGERAEQSGLVDAIADPGDPSAYSATGYRRITELGSELHALRSRLGQPLTELTADVERVLGIGIEAGARSRGGEALGAGREHLDAFADVVADYGDQPTATLSGLLGFLAAADSVENGLAPGEVEVAAHRVQVLTVHAAKGLEWEVVAVPHMSRGVFPSSTAPAYWLGSVAELPPSLRGDRARDADDEDGVPVLDLSDAYNRKDVETALTAHKDALKRRKLAEDRRLFYVAVTRTERALYVSGYHWDSAASAPRGASDFLAELHDFAVGAGSADGVAVVDLWAPAPEDGAENPFGGSAVSAIWPADPLGTRRDAVEFGAAAVLVASAELDNADNADSRAADDDPEGWAADIDALLAERDARRTGPADVIVPGQLSVSQLVDLVADPDALAAKLRRPVPYPPNPLARRGTAFHAWVERRFGATRLLDMDELPGAADTGAAHDSELSKLQDAFSRSPWALRSPIEVEVPFETTVAGVVLRGRIDAVFADSDGGWTVIDWKTGAEPSPEDERAVTMQLAAYRVAWAELASAAHPERPVPLDSVRAAFHYVRSGRTIAPDDLPDARELERLIENSGRG
ncbi:putative ATP-dependent DNA helicase [Rhodococcoides trifolii]|uniref:DNA 3'-5' helicase n=1 Tax=Rhodococcoides trifolii TaxID=908250 RepID=A0A917D4K8_9NOCA|nr:UvrD-helicase domain-containing protein [Rhodococcus trifolii]GGG12238.1 putative ATP-dependent DNA helicase [Rhodococcus trifolii]